ncbi:spermidine synthase [Actinotalea solisilvae]|uniref:spermidine synthase n=1 Tax=Actinotalea solisilvae TaxID=2072922 RepID=UPI0018F2708E|nr:spermidine synthase [Actinotalea solisilvae]
MRSRLVELDFEQTPIGGLSLRRRVEPVTGREVHEVKLGDEYIMSSLFVEGEEELARIALARLAGDGPFDVMVTGLGLGYTAAAALADARVGALVVVEALPTVVRWHREGLVPLGPVVAGDARTSFVTDDFFAVVREGRGLDGGGSPRRFHALVVDIDHSPRHVLAPAHADLYTAEGLGRLMRHLHPDGVFALWSDDPPDAEFLAVLQGVRPGAEAAVVEFANPLAGGRSANTVYVAGAPPGVPGR